MARQAIDLTGKVFGRLTVLGLGAHSGAARRWLCECIHQNGEAVTTLVQTKALTGGQTKSCGCLKSERYDSATINLTGKIFGRLTVISVEQRNGSRRKRWHVLCGCGKSEQFLARSCSLTSGKTESCGCKRNDVTSALLSRRIRMRVPIGEGKYKGVNVSCARFAARFKRSHLGTFPTPEAAARAYDAAAFAEWGTDCYLNFPEDYGLPSREPKA